MDWVSLAKFSPVLYLFLLSKDNACHQGLSLPNQQVLKFSRTPGDFDGNKI